jgi:four helix bundle protein
VGFCHNSYMTIQSFEDVVAWQKGRELYGVLHKSLTTYKDYSFKDQLLRATLSITNNIAEGFDRGSSKELKQFLIIARGSAAEVRSMLLLAKDLSLFNEKDIEESLVIVKDILRLLTGFIKSINGQQTTENR